MLECLTDIIFNVQSVLDVVYQELVTILPYEARMPEYFRRRVTNCSMASKKPAIVWRYLLGRFLLSLMCKIDNLSGRG